MIRTGIDLVETKRIKTLYEKKNFKKYFLTDSEIEMINNDAGKDAETGDKIIPYNTIAGLFACKEAVAKALGVGFSLGWRYNEIEIKSGEIGAPYVVLHGKMKERFEFLKGKEISVSISHDSGFAVAVCVING